MTQRLLTPRRLASTAVLLAAGGLIGLACGSDSPAPVAEGESPLNPVANPANAAGGSGAAAPGAPSGGAAPVSSAGSEGQPNEVPLNPGAAAPGEPGAPSEPGEPGVETPPVTASPSTGLAPNCNPPEGEPPTLSLALVAGGLDNPLFVASAPGDDTRLFVVQQGGVVRVLVNGEIQQQPFIDISGNVMNGGERGLLGLAFHPNYAENGLFYLHFSSLQNNGNGRIAEFAVDANNRSVANPGSRRDIFLFANDPAGNHNGGDLTFGPDGFLYIGMGDGGNQDDPHGPIGNAQNLQSPYGKILRLDVNGRAVNDAYSIPPNNLAAQTGRNALPEVWAYGLRNPWRFSFDACTQDLYIADVGGRVVEEIDFLPAGTLAGTNFGWRIMEGPDCRPAAPNNDPNPSGSECAQLDRSTVTAPIDSYTHADVGISVTGGYVYRGSAVPGLRGRYLYADYFSGRAFSIRVEGGQLADKQDVTDQLRPTGANADDFARITSFGRDNAGEVYVTAYQPNGAVYRIVAAP